MEGVTGLRLQSRLDAKHYCHTTFIPLPAHTKPSLNICSMSDTENVAGGYFKEKGGKKKNVDSVTCLPLSV